MDGRLRAREQPAGQLLYDPSFESTQPGRLRPTGAVRDGWEIQQTGRKAIQDRLVVRCIDDEAQAKSGEKCLSLSIPRATAGFEFVTVGQRRRLDVGREYEASVWVRWANGPQQAPPEAAPPSPAAIVSFWVRHRDGTGHFAGRDAWLFDNEWKKLVFRFRATDSRQPSLVYVSLLPNQKPAATSLLVDDFQLHEQSDDAQRESRSGSLVRDADFGQQRGGKIAPPWYFANIGGKRIAARFRSRRRIGSSR